MEKIGASVYLHLASIEEIKNYTELLGQNNVKTIFTTFINFKKTNDEHFRKLVLLMKLLKSIIFMFLQILILTLLMNLILILEPVWNLL